MGRSSLAVREADKEDLPLLVSLLADLRDLGPRRLSGRTGRSDSEQLAAQERFLAAMADPDQRVLVVTDGSTVVGMSLLALEPASRLVEVPMVTMSHVMVSESHRRRGAGRCLLGAALAFAEERGVEAIAVDVYPTQREANRYYARLGFGPVVTRRVAPLSTLRRHFGGRDAMVELDSAQRRRLRMRVRAGALRSRAAARPSDPL